MREEASLEQWRTLYDAATKIKEQKPWEKFWDMDLIGIRKGAAIDTVFISVLGRGGECYGIAAYEGYEGLNRFLMIAMQQSMDLSSEYVMFNQKNLTCYWGNRDELTDKQRKIIKDLGYTYRGKNQWLYFLSVEPGYFLYNMDAGEVLRVSEHLRDMGTVLQQYDEENLKVDFEEGNMLLATFDKNKGIWSLAEAPLPFTSFQFGNLVIENKEVLSELEKVSKCNMVLEADISIMGISVADKKYSRPANPALLLLGDAVSGTIINFQMSEPEDDPMITLAEMLIDFILQYGAPKEIRVTNIIVESGLEQLCDICGIKLRRVKRLKGVDSFRQSMQRFY